MAAAKIVELAHQYSDCPNFTQRKVYLQDIIDFFTDMGFAEFQTHFWGSISETTRENFVNDLFIFLVEVRSIDRMYVLELLQALCVEPPPGTINVCDTIFKLAEKNLNDNSNYKQATAGLNFFSHLWQNTDISHPIHEKIFAVLLKLLENRDSLLVSEGIFELIKLIEQGTTAQRQAVFGKLFEVIKKRKEEDIQYAVFEMLNDFLAKYRGELTNLTEAQLNSVVLELFTLKVKELKPTFALLRLVFSRGFVPTAKEEAKILEILKSGMKSVTYEIQEQFWKAVFAFIQNAFHTPKNVLLRPFFEKLQSLYKHRMEISPEVASVIEDFVNWLWEQTFLSQEERDSFY